MVRKSQINYHSCSHFSNWNYYTNLFNITTKQGELDLVIIICYKFLMTDLFEFVMVLRNYNKGNFDLK